MKTYLLFICSVLTRDISTAPPQVVCDSEDTDPLTVISLLPQETETEVTYVTSSTRVTVWIAYALPKPHPRDGRDMY